MTSVKKLNLPWTSLWKQFGEVSSRLCRADVLVYGLILSVAVFQFHFTARETDFPADDVFFSDSGRALIEHGFYGLNGYSETNMPPGLPAILGILGTVWGHSHSVVLRAMAIFGALALLASYELLRRQVPRIVAAAICLLLMSSVPHFWLVANQVCPSYPFMFTTLSALLVCRRIERTTSLTPRIIWGALLATLLVISLLLASAAIAFFGAIVVSLLGTFVRNRSLALERLKIYLPVLVIGLAVQGLWIRHDRVDASAGISAAEWPIPGFPQSYFSQLKVKNGNDPEMGLATPLDVAVRIANNVRAQCDFLSRMLLRLLPPVEWSSIFVIVPFLLIGLGWYDSVRRSNDGLQEWYFAGYELIYLLWPWNLEARFFVPIMPLACLFLWRGGNAFVLVLKNNLRVISLASLAVTPVLAICAWFSIHGPPIRSQHRFAELQDELSFVIWILLALLSAWIVWRNIAGLEPSPTLLRSFRRSLDSLQIDPRGISRSLGMVLVVGLVVVGLKMQLEIGRYVLDPNSSANNSPDAAAGKWIRAHTDKDVVVMARHVPTACHYSERRVIWFPPSSDPQLLMKGVAEHKVDFVIVAHREDPYYLPPDDKCFANLFASYPDAFHLVCEGPEFKIFKVTSNDPFSSRLSLGVVH
jgi:hypothetical protein